MSNYAIVQGDSVINVIVCDSKEIAEQVTGLTAIETEGNPWIGWKIHEGVWRSPMPETGGPWIWNEETEEWEE